MCTNVQTVFIIQDKPVERGVLGMRRKAAEARIDMRISSQRKYFLELAAFVGGYDSLSNFMTIASEQLAKSVFDKTGDESRTLSAKDQNLLLNFLQNAPEPNAELKAAYKKIASLYQLDESGQATYELGPDFIKHID